MISRRMCLKALYSSLGAVAAGGVVPLFSQSKEQYQIARFWHKEGEHIIKCELCPHGCVLYSGQTGICRNRTHRDGKLIALGYAQPCAVHVDPIEKKPLYHMMPGARTYSIGVAGCNLRCKNCQNYTISQRSPVETNNLYLPPDKVVANAIQEKCKVIAFTYTEPSVWLEYVIDTSKKAKKAGLKTVLVSSGYINPTPLEELIEVLDAARIDLKSFSNKVYQNLNAGKLQPVLSTIKQLKKRGVWLEIINLIVPQWNDNPKQIGQLCSWMKQELGADVPIHFSRFYPIYQLKNSYPTPVSTLKKAKLIALDAGINYVYIGNVAEIGSETFCPVCKKKVVDRKGYVVFENKVIGGKCAYCGTAIPGFWESV